MYLNYHGPVTKYPRHFGDNPTGFGMGSYLSASTTAKTGFLSFSQDTIIGDISFLLLCGVGVMLVAPSLPMLGQKIKGLVGGNK